MSEQAKNLVHRRYSTGLTRGKVTAVYIRCKCQEISGEGELLLLLADRRRYFANDQPLTVRHNSNGDLEDRLVMSRQQQIYVANTANTNVLSRISFGIQIDEKFITIPWLLGAKS